MDNRYVVSSVLGSGGMGKVYLARDEVLDRDVALKVLREQYAESEEFVERFEREARAAASLNYPNIVQVYDRGETPDGTYYIAMEHVPGGTLKDRILKEGSLDAAEASRLASQVADALGVAHGRGIVHRDVKPQNVLLSARGDAKVADFGIARAAFSSSVSNSSLVLGTAKYMSPEQAMGDPAGPGSDLYSLGVVLYEMLTGEVPFEADSSVGVAMKHVMERPRSPRETKPEIPEALDAVVMRLLEKKPEDRYPGAAELVADLQRVRDGLPPVFAAPAASRAETTERLAAPVPANPGGARRDLPRSPGRRRRRLPAIAAVLVALLGLLGLAGLGVTRSPDGPVVGSLGEAVENARKVLNVGEGRVPGVVGLTEEEARTRLEDEGFGVFVERRASAEKDRGKVLEQSVLAGQEARRGARIALAVGAPRTVKAPDLVGLTPAKSEDALEKAGLKLGDRKEAPSEEVPAGEVAAQDPAAGKKTETGSAVDLTISSGPPKDVGGDRVEVPEVSGLGVEGATALLREAGCTVSGKKTEPSPEPAGTVLRTDPPIGTAVASGTPVVLILSGGPGSGEGVTSSGDSEGQPSATVGPSSPATASPDASASPAGSAPPEPTPEGSSPEGSSPEPNPPEDPPISPSPSSPEQPSPEQPAPTPSEATSEPSTNAPGASAPPSVPPASPPEPSPPSARSEPSEPSAPSAPSEPSAPSSSPATASPEQSAPSSASSSPPASSSPEEDDYGDDAEDAEDEAEEAEGTE